MGDDISVVMAPAYYDLLSPMDAMAAPATHMPAQSGFNKYVELLHSIW